VAHYFNYRWGSQWKSTFGEKLAEESGKEVIYLATARVEDEEMRERVKLHQSRRPTSVKLLKKQLNHTW
jgi:adenosylcobinamide kinase / adenosylcobinamide-phosphate guanylyltransferase